MMKRYLNKSDATHEIRYRSGLIPVDIDVDQRQLIWLDMGKYHFYEGRFRKAVSTYIALKQKVSGAAQTMGFVTDMDILKSDRILHDSIYPSGFIFHMTRCGSTLLAKSLARSRAHLVFSEAAPHAKFWQLLGGSQPWQIEGSEENLSMFRNLILAMGRRRLPEHNYHFVKFVSVDVLFIALIREAFPDVPMLFLYRDPTEVLVSLLKRDTSWLKLQDSVWGAFVSGATKATRSDSLTYYTAALRNFLSAALLAERKGLRFLNYDQISANNLAAILAAFGVNYATEQLTQMQTQFGYYSKAEYRVTSFTSDKVEKQEARTPEIVTAVNQHLQPLYTRLLQSPQNIIVKKSLNA